MLLTFLQRRYLLQPQQPLEPSSQQDLSTYSLGPDPATTRVSQSTSTSKRFRLKAKIAGSSFAAVAKLGHWARSARSRLRWLTVAKDLVTVLVGLVTVIQFLWPILLWAWNTGLYYLRLSF